MIEIERLGKRFGDVVAVDDVSLTMQRGTITALVGASGSGKSTLLRMINRLIAPSTGTVRIDGVDTASVPPEQLRRRIGYAIQGHGLFPHWSVARNIATVPRLLGWDAARIDARVRELLALFNLAPEEFAEKLPHELSGGQQQRVGVARALAAEPAMLLMDEPFGALDPIIRGKAQDDLLALQRRLGITVVLVTHDIEEALKLGDTIAVMDGGRLLQVAPPAEILGRPAAGVVEQLVAGVDRPLRLLALTPVGDVAEPGSADGPPIAATRTLRDAISELLWRGVDALPVADDDDGNPSPHPAGTGRGARRITLDAIRAHARRPG
ncbi:ABC transporter ATP-binding protein [Burkholderia ubonensis]|uniref:ABC transporter ATP-binding protein n=1 Tax=Burkholderia ubonensis TaxID=101571 RepID=UPI000752037D|nr:ABC transporter ATP-binding protein [Burkholderia ubonensis]KVA24607.1 amino acid ABC transporter ATP-binding protein [Burkholderia ubonensis]KVA28084.1 amino acid ABC transporter ATP-binding protein [Burkholderia ubonensis]KVA37713.1 amino acid ABC transporter ATP-binding protein [Burkholderia ubonensis]